MSDKAKTAVTRFALSAVICALAGLFTLRSGEIFAGLAKPFLTAPPWLLTAGWIASFMTLAVASVIQPGGAVFKTFLVSLCLALLIPVFFFRLELRLLAGVSALLLCGVLLFWIKNVKNTAAAARILYAPTVWSVYIAYICIAAAILN